MFMEKRIRNTFCDILWRRTSGKLTDIQTSWTGLTLCGQQVELNKGNQNCNKIGTKAALQSELARACVQQQPQPKQLLQGSVCDTNVMVITRVSKKVHLIHNSTEDNLQGWAALALRRAPYCLRFYVPFYDGLCSPAHGAALVRVLQQYHVLSQANLV